MKITEATIRGLIVEVLAELEPKSRLSMDSLDDQIDSLLIKFEDESIVKQDVEEALFFKPSLRFLLEKDDEKDDEEDVADDDTEEPAVPEEDDKTADSSDQEIDEPAEPMKPDIDISQFAMRVARLLDHTDSLLDLSSVVINRAKKFLGDNYDPATAEEFESILEREFGVSLEPKDNQPERHLAVGAGPTG